MKKIIIIITFFLTSCICNREHYFNNKKYNLDESDIMVIYSYGYADGKSGNTNGMNEFMDRHGFTFHKELKSYMNKQRR